MFLGSAIDFLAPNYVGRIVDQFKVDNFRGDGGVQQLVLEWVLVTVGSGVCSFLRDFIFGVTS